MKWLLSPGLRVAIFVVFTTGIVAGMALRVTNDPSWKGPTRRAWFYVEDASGLQSRSMVMMGGMRVGVIKKIILERDRAKVFVVVEDQAVITTSTRVEIRPDGILGDKHVELVAGNFADPALPNDAQIADVEDRASVDRLIIQVTRISKAVAQVAENFKQAVNGNVGKPLGRILRDLDHLTSDLAHLTQTKKGEMGEIVEGVHAITRTLNGLLSGKGNNDMIASLKTAMKSIQKVEKSIQNLEAITGKINGGSGTIGKLVNDEETVSEVMETVSTVNAYLDEINKLQTTYDFHSQYLGTGAGYKTTIGILIEPGPDRFYELGVAYDPVGVNEATLANTDGNPQNPNVHQSIRFEDALRFNVLFGKRFGNWSVKAGLLESSAGGAIDYSIAKGRFDVMVEALSFPNTNLRATLKGEVWKGLYAYGGVDDIFDQKHRFGPFIGLGYSINSEDLKVLLAAVTYQEIPNSHN